MKLWYNFSFIKYKIVRLCYEICKKNTKTQKKLDNNKEKKSVFINSEKRFGSLILIYLRLPHKY